MELSSDFGVRLPGSNGTKAKEGGEECLNSSSALDWTSGIWTCHLVR